MHKVDLKEYLFVQCDNDATRRETINNAIFSLHH